MIFKNGFPFVQLMMIMIKICCQDESLQKSAQYQKLDLTLNYMYQGCGELNLFIVFVVVKTYIF